VVWVKRQQFFADGDAHCDAAPGLTVSVDHGGKLFERIEVKNQPVTINWIGKTHPGNPLYKASFCSRHGNRQARGAFRIAGLGSFVTFLAHQENLTTTS
jgi:hypothetical protein